MLSVISPVIEAGEILVYCAMSFSDLKRHATTDAHGIFDVWIKICCSSRKRAYNPTHMTALCSQDQLHPCDVGYLHPSFLWPFTVRSATTAEYKNPLLAGWCSTFPTPSPLPSCTAQFFSANSMQPVCCSNTSPVQNVSISERPQLHSVSLFIVGVQSLYGL